MLKKRSIVWFRQDLRLHDNEALYEAAKASDEIIPVYVFDTRKYERIVNGLYKIGPYRAKFIIDSVSQLRASLRDIGSDLIIRVGHPEEEVAKIASKLKTQWVFCNRERTSEELEIQEKLEESLWAIGQEIRFSRGKMLYYTQDLPFPITQTPDLFSGFRKEVERFVAVRELLPTPPEPMPPYFPAIESGQIPDLKSLGYTDDMNSSMVHPNGGETEGILQVESALDRISDGGEAKMQISPWLSLGCVSPKFVYHKLDGLKKKTLQSLVKEVKRNLMLRDYHRLMGKKYTHKIFTASGLAESDKPQGKRDIELLSEWILGETEDDFVNACMKELGSTGFISHQKRRVVAYYLLHQLEVHWLLGAQYFEGVLLDYDPCSNYGNWQRCAGISLDQKGELDVNFETAANKLDPEEKYRKYWLSKTVPSFMLPDTSDL